MGTIAIGWPLVKAEKFEKNNLYKIIFSHSIY